MQFSSKTFLPFAVAALSTAALVTATPANALNFSRTNSIPTPGTVVNGSPIQALNPGTLPSGVALTPGSNPLSGNYSTTSSSGGSITLNDSDPIFLLGFPVGSTSDGNATFTFANPLAFFGANLATSGLTSSQLGNVSFVISGITNGLVTTQTRALSAFTGSGSFYTVNASSALERFTSVSILNNTNTVDVTFDNLRYNVPTPALLPGLLGLGVAAWRKRKGEAAEKVGSEA